MYTKSILRLILISLGIALLLAGLFFDGGAAGTVTPRATAINTLTAMQRLAEPTLPVSPSQADYGAQDYWLYCLPCHGDRGQGLTDEFRQTYPPDETNCWESGCHGKRPYDNGFKLPTTIPAVIGKGTLQKFSNAAVLRSYIFAAMPYWDPGSLKEDEAWQITAFLLRANGLWDAREELTTSNADRIPVGPPPAAPTPIPAAGFASGFPLPFVIVLAVILLFFFLPRILRKKGS